MNIPDWIQSEVKAFGKNALKMENFALNDSGMAGVRLEDGCRVRLEYRDEILFVYAMVPGMDTVDEMMELLMDANPRRSRSRPVHVGVAGGQSVRMMKLSGENISSGNIDLAFRWLWKRQ